MDFMRAGQALIVEVDRTDELEPSTRR